MPKKLTIRNQEFITAVASKNQIYALVSNGQIIVYDFSKNQNGSTKLDQTIPEYKTPLGVIENGQRVKMIDGPTPRTQKRIIMATDGMIFQQNLGTKRKDFKIICGPAKYTNTRSYTSLMQVSEPRAAQHMAS